MKIVDGKYQYSKFSKEDLKMYKEVLEQSPYDAELEAFFIEQGALDRRIRQQDARHIAPIPLEYIDNYTMRQSAEDEYFLLANNKKLHDAMERLTPEQFERTYELFFEGKAISQIAERDSKWEGSVGHSLIEMMPYINEQWTTFFEKADGWKIPVGGKIDLIELSPALEESKESVRKALSTITVLLTYTDVYGTIFKDSRKLDFFSRHFRIN